MALDIETRKQPVCLCSGFGRVFYAVDNIVYFSQVLVEDATSLGKCYQNNDPVSEDIPDIVDTDGGEIKISDANKILSLISYQNGILLFASNGVWYLQGGNSGFTATQYIVKRLTNRGIRNQGSFLVIRTAVLYSTKTGIESITVNQYGELEVSNITDVVIKTKFQDMFQDYPIYFSENKDKDILTIYSTSTRSFLFYDMILNAFLPQEFKETAVYPTPAYTLVDILGNYSDISGFNLMLVDKSPGSPSIRMARFTNKDFTDFGENFDSYLITQQETLGKFSHKKGISTLSVAIKRTEQNITEYVDGDYTYDFPNSCVMESRWDFDNSSSGNRWNTPVNLYRINNRGYVPEALPEALGIGESIFFNRINVRGSGNAVQFKFSAEAGKDMQLLGYNVVYTVRGRQ